MTNIVLNIRLKLLSYVWHQRLIAFAQHDAEAFGIWWQLQTILNNESVALHENFRLLCLYTVASRNELGNLFVYFLLIV